MKIYFALLALLAFASAESEVKKQEAVLRLLYRVHEPIPNSFSRLHEAAHNYNPHDHHDSFKDGGSAADHLDKEIDDHRVSPQHTVFSLFNPRQREEALMLFEVLMKAKDFETFAASAAHYRHRMNEGEFVYALYVAVIHSDLTQHVVLPPLYEVTPHMFTNNEVIQQAYSAKMRQQDGTFKMSFTGTEKNPEQRVAYFGEDIGLNVHHVTWHMDFPFWWEDKYGYHLDRKGELFFWAHHQLTARFDAERLSNNLDIVDELYWDRPINEGFAPHTSYKYGGEFPSRPDGVYFEDVDSVAKVRDMIIMESRVRDAIAHGYAVAKDGSKIDIRNERGINILGNIIESSLYSPNREYYGALHNLAHIILGRQGDPHGKFGMPPGVMEHFETATRDPAFFRLHKYMDNIFKEHKDSLPPYTAEDLAFSGVGIDNVSVGGALETYFEDFVFPLRNAVDTADGIEEVKIFAKVSRLAHTPFTIKIEATNNNGGTVKTTVRAFLCPTYDYNGIKHTLDSGRWGCIEVDKFQTDLSPGHNTISRSSEDSSVTVPDVPSFKTLIDKTIAGEAPDASRSCGIPNRLLLPKGKPEGMTFTLVIALSDGAADSAIDQSTLDPHTDVGTHAQCGVHGELYPDKRPMGFPLDRRIPDPRVGDSLPNLHHSHVTVTHKH